MTRTMTTLTDCELDALLADLQSDWEGNLPPWQVMMFTQHSRLRLYRLAEHIAATVWTAQDWKSVFETQAPNAEAWHAVPYGEMLNLMRSDIREFLWEKTCYH